MPLSLIFSETSLEGKFNIVDNTNFNIVFTVTETNIQNLDIYLQNVPLNTIVASISILNPNQGALLTGALYYTSTNPVQFKTDIVFNPGDNIIGIITLNFAYIGITPIFSNGVFGGALLTYTIPEPYVVVTNTNPLTIDPINITTLPVITVYPNPEPCFLEDTLILTPNGYVKVKNLKDGDNIIVSVYSGERCLKENSSLSTDKSFDINEKNITKIKKIICYKSNQKNLYCICKNSLLENNLVVTEDLYITGGHAIKINDSYRHVKCLHKDAKYNQIKLYEDADNIITYYHIELYTWENNFIIANGLEIEPYYENSNVNDKWISWNCTEGKCDYKILPVEK
jgi:hypothetical protein